VARQRRQHAQSQPEKHDHTRPASQSWEDEIRHHLRPGFVVMGVGSRLRGDDAAGSIVAEQLSARGVENAFDCAGVPENYIGRVEKLQPADILFIDVADFGAAPGAIEFFGGQSVQAQSISTHSAGLSPLMDFLAASCDAVCWMLAIQPADVAYGADLSEPVRQAVEEIVSSPVWLEVGQ
jgi:hydrogenase 3 maturation protease